MVNFFKYHGLGNDFIVLDGQEETLGSNITSGDPLFIKNICNRHFGIGADGLILSLPSKGKCDVRMQIFNSDGTEAEMCGNGIRCLVKYLFDINKIDYLEELTIETLSGTINASLNKNSLITVNMGTPTFNPSNIPTKLSINSLGLPEGLINIDSDKLTIYAAGMGNPHMIVIVSNVDEIPFEKWGGILENNEFFPAKTNVHFIQVKSRKLLKVKVWERGCGPTLACGTGACACAVIMYKLGLCETKVAVDLPGGQLVINWPDNKSDVFMEGPALLVYSGAFSPKSFHPNIH